MAKYQSQAVKNGLKFDVINTPGSLLCRSGKISGIFQSGDILEMVPIPKNAMVMNVQIVLPGAMAAGTTLDVGDGLLANRFFTALSGAAAIAKNSSDSGSITTAHGFIFTDNDSVDVKITTAQSAQKDIILHVYYKMVQGFVEDEYQTFKVQP